MLIPISNLLTIARAGFLDVASQVLNSICHLLKTNLFLKCLSWRTYGMKEKTEAYHLEKCELSLIYIALHEM